MTADGFGGETTVRLRGGGYEAVFLPGLGMLGASLTKEGTELLSLHGGVDAYRGGHTTGMPLLAPWANRLSQLRFRAAGVNVDLNGVPLHTGADGLPRHGTMGARSGWQLVGVKPNAFVARFAYDTPELLAAFPFPHELEVDASLSARGLRVTTRVRPLRRRAVPVAFGWHPYFKVGGARSRWKLRLPERTAIGLDERGIPTGGIELRPAENEPLGKRAFDDLFALGEDRRFALEGGGRRIELRFDERYPYLQVYAPPGESFIAIEPMAAPTDALVQGGAPVVKPGEDFAASFIVSAKP
jgi:galactose mutarotase-like enzyme